MKQRKIERDIEITENVLGVLYRCLTFYKGLGDIRQCKDTRLDITIVEEELRILIAEKEAELNATKEP